MIPLADLFSLAYDYGYLLARAEQQHNHARIKALEAEAEEYRKELIRRSGRGLGMNLHRWDARKKSGYRKYLDEQSSRRDKHVSSDAMGQA